MAPKADLDLDAYFPYLINRVGAALVTTFGKDPLGRHQLNIAMWRALAALSRNGGLRLVDLAEVTSIDVSTLSRMVTRLIRLGLVLRTRSKTSDREVLVSSDAEGTASARPSHPRRVAVRSGVDGRNSAGRSGDREPRPSQDAREHDASAVASAAERQSRDHAASSQITRRHDSLSSCSEPSIQATAAARSRRFRQRRGRC